MVLVTSACGEGSNETACMYDLARDFASRIYKVCKLKKTEQLLDIKSLWTRQNEPLLEAFADM